MKKMIQNIKNSLKYWYVPLIIGVLLIAVGIYIFTTPLNTYLFLATIVSMMFIIGGISEILFYLSNRTHIHKWGWHVVVALLTLALGLFLLIQPMSSAFILALFIAFIVLMKSLQGLVMSYNLKDLGISNWYFLAIISIFGVLLALLIVIQPMFVAISVVFLTAIGFIIAGVIGVFISLLLRRLRNAGRNFQRRFPR